MLADRCHNYRQAEIDRQTAAARKDWMRQRKEKLDGLTKQVNTNPVAAVAALATFGLGVQWLGTCFQELIQEVETQGHLSEDSLQWAVRVYGVTPTPQEIRGDLITYVVSLNNLGCTPGARPEVIDAWLDPAHRPHVLQDKRRDEVMGADAEQCREAVLAELEFEHERLKSEEKRLARDVDGPGLEAVLNRAGILTEEAAKRVARSHAESRANFHRGLTNLYRTLDRDEEQGPAEEASDNDDRPATERAAAAEAGDRAEAKSDAPGDVATVAAAHVVEGADRSPNDPEKPSDDSAQTADNSEVSVDTSASARVRPEGIPREVPAGPETAPGFEAEAPRQEGQTDGAVREPVRLPTWATLVPLSASRRVPDSPDDPEEGRNDPAQVVVNHDVLHHPGASGSGRSPGVLRPAAAVAASVGLDGTCGARTSGHLQAVGKGSERYADPPEDVVSGSVGSHPGSATEPGDRPGVWVSPDTPVLLG